MSGGIFEQAIQAGWYTTQPLSGSGQTIVVHSDPLFRLVLWAGLMFELSNEMIRTILDEFFIERGRWYPLGASMTEPDPAGLGSFIWKTFPSFSPRYASAIAAILVHEGFVTFRGRKPIHRCQVKAKHPILHTHL